MYQDNRFRIDYNPVDYNDIFNKNQVGVSLAETLPGYTGESAEAVAVDTSTGTIAAGITSTGIAIPYVNVTDADDLVVEDVTSADYTYFQGLFSSDGNVKLSRRALDDNYTDSNAIFVSAAGDDTNAGTQSAPKRNIFTSTGAIKSCTTGKPVVVILDSETYTEIPCDILSTDHCTTIVADYDCTPIIKVQDNTSNFSLTQFSEIETIQSWVLSGVGQQFSVGLANGNIIVFALTGTSGNSYLTGYLYDAEYNLLGSKQYSSTPNMAYMVGQACSHGSNIAIAFVDPVTQVVYLLVIDENLEVVHYTSVASGGAYQAGIVTLTDDNDSDLAIFYCTASGNYRYIYYKTIDGTDYTVSSATLSNNYDYYGIKSIKLVRAKDGYIHFYIALLSDNAQNHYIGHRKYNSALELQGTPTIVEVLSKIDYMQTTILDDRVFICWVHANTTDGVFYRIYNTDFDLITDTTNIDVITGSMAGLGTAIDAQGYLRLIYTESVALKSITFKPGTYSINLEKDVDFNGLTFQCDDVEYFSYFIKANASIKASFKWCNFENLKASNDICLTQPITIYDELEILNCKFIGCSGKVYAESNTVTIEDSQFSGCSEYTIHVKGSGANVKINHCDITDNNAGLRLENNDGDEVVKNNIIHLNNSYGINADTDLTITGTCYTDILNNITIGISCINANPLYVDPDNNDYNLQMRVLGNPVDSPAYDIADDNRNAGALDVHYIIGGTSWDTVYINKPKEIKRYVKLNADKTTRRDGSIATRRNSMTEFIEFNLDVIPTAEYNYLLSVLTGNSNRVQLYINPDTYPANYYQYVIVYDDDINNFAKHYKLTRTGVQKNVLTLARKYEV